MKLNTYTVLVIDNNADMRRLHQMLLSSKVRNCTILEAESITESRAILESEKPDLIIM